MAYGGASQGTGSQQFLVLQEVCEGEIVQYTGYNLYLQILFYRTTRHIANIEIEHFSREEGSSNYNFKKAFRLFMSFMNYTVIPLRIAEVMGTLFSIAGFIGAIAVFIQKMVRPDMAVGMEFPDVCYAPVLRNYFPDAGSAGGICGQADPEPE